MVNGDDAQNTIEDVISPKRKIFVVDTSAIIDQPGCIRGLSKGGNIVAIPKIVVHELDNVSKSPKKDQDTKDSAQEGIREIGAMHRAGYINSKLSEYLAGNIGGSTLRKTPEGGHVFWEHHSKPLTGFGDSNNDDHVIGTGLYIASQNQGKHPIIIIAEDTNLLLKVASSDLEIRGENLRMNNINPAEQPYEGYTELFVPPALLEQFYNSGAPRKRSISKDDLLAHKVKNAEQDFFWNQGIVLIDQTSNNRYVITRYDKEKGGQLRDLRYALQNSGDDGKQTGTPISIYGFTPGDPRQILALEFLLDPTIRLAIIEGKAGTGKNRLMMSAAIYTIVHNGRALNLETSGAMFEHMKRAAQELNSELPRFTQGISLIRPEYSSSEFDPGTQPGNMDKKLGVYMGPFDQSIKRISEHMKMDIYAELRKVKMLEYVSTALLRGMNIENRIALIDEFQNGNRRLAKTVMSRFADSAKGIIAGDETQRDNPYVGNTNNALALVRSLYKDEGPYIAHMTLSTNYRGRISLLAEKL